MSRTPAVSLVALLAALSLSGCVGQARTTGAYRGKASHSATTVESALQTALLAVQTSAKGRLLHPYLEVLLSDAEDTAGSVQQQFDSIQPPNTSEADGVRQKLDTLLTQSSDVLSQLRIAARRDDEHQLVKTAATIPKLAKKLDDFAKATS